jgi:UDP-N-acetylglucosamine 2-epimerase
MVARKRQTLDALKQKYPDAYKAIKTIASLAISPYRRLRRTIKILRARQLEQRTISLEEKKIAACREKCVIQVAFVIVHQSTWKTNLLYNLLRKEKSFNPIIIVAPDTRRPLDWSDSEIDLCVEYFSKRDAQVFVASRDDAENRALLQKIKPDVVILNNPHQLSPSSLHMDLLHERLACYIPYHMEVGRYDGDQSQYNQSFHNAMWKIFAPHDTSLRTFRQVARRKGKNVIVTGYPGIEHLLATEDTDVNPWKPLGLKRIIWAPHHTIDMPSLPYANFLRYAEHFRKLVDDYADRVQWCFKPHPLLKPKLIRQPDWGPERTEEYYAFWERHPNTQMEVGEYASLFRHSDAMIHDSGSFLAEYLYVDKPVMYLWSSPRVVKFFNEFGLQALGACERGDTEADIHRFIDSVLSGDDRCRNKRRAFLKRHPVSINGELPSDRILKEIKSAIWLS